MYRTCMQSRRWRWALGLILTLVLGGCSRLSEPAPQATQPPVAKPAAADSALAPAEQRAEALPEIERAGEPKGSRQAAAPRTREQFNAPLVEHADRLKRLDPKAPIWIDPEAKKVVLVAAVCQRKVPLELFACVEGTKEYESILAVPVQAKAIHAALVAVGADPGHPVQFGEKYVAAAGPVIDIALFWKDEQGKTQTAKAQDWVRDVRTHEAMTQPWVFGGSQLVKDEESGQTYYVADSSGDLICVSNFPDATMDVPVESTDSDASLLFEAFTERIPSRGTPVTLVLSPQKAK